MDSGELMWVCYLVSNTAVPRANLEQTATKVAPRSIPTALGKVVGQRKEQPNKSLALVDLNNDMMYQLLPELGLHLWLQVP